jgi:hypothetical protein
MIYFYIVMGAFGALVMLGYKYRLAMISYALMWTAVYLMQKTSYNNHYYLLMLLNWVMCFLPANRAFSLDARLNPKIKEAHCPQWCLWFFTLQVTIVYIYASVAKMYPDWVSGEVVSIFFAGKRNYILIGSMLQYSWLIMLISWGGLLFDLLIAPALMWNRTRQVAFLISIFFHLFNSAVFQVGIFPYLGIAFALFFYPPAQIRRLFFRNHAEVKIPSNHYSTNKWVTAILAIYFLFQIILPLRHWRYEGNVYWTEEGHRLSWRMMLRAKSGNISFRVKTDSAEWIIPATDYVTNKQASKIATRPDMCWQFVQILKSDLESNGIESPEIYPIGTARLNKRPYAPLYNPNTNLSEVDWEPFQHASWLLPMPARKESVPTLSQ